MTPADRRLPGLILLVGSLAVVVFAVVTPHGRAPDDFRYYQDISRFAHNGDLSTTTGGRPHG